LASVIESKISTSNWLANSHSNMHKRSFNLSYLHGDGSITAFPCLFSVLAIALFIYYTSVPAGTEARTEVK